jgi:hypothetical protein
MRLLLRADPWSAWQSFINGVIPAQTGIQTTFAIAKSALRTACPRNDRAWQSNIPSYANCKSN